MKIIVVGSAGEGKSTIAKLIADVLKERGFQDVKVVDSLQAEEAHLSDSLSIWHQRKRLDALPNILKDITIETMQYNKSAVKN